MNFVISCSELLNHLQSVGKVISSKSTIPILDCFLFTLTDGQLEIKASDKETTLITNIPTSSSEGDGSIAIEAKRLTDILKEFPEQPLKFSIDLEKLSVNIKSENGDYNETGQNSADYPEISITEEEEEFTKFSIPSDVLFHGISKSIFATADDELRPIMNGIFLEKKSNECSFAASDAHKLVWYRRSDISDTTETSFILPKKPAALLKNILPKEQGDITIKINNKNAYFELSKYRIICQLIEGTYPSYASVIPENNPNEVIVNRVNLLNVIKRVSVYSNQASNLVKIIADSNLLTIKAQDIDFSISAEESLVCQYVGNRVEIGFKSTFFAEILANLSSDDVIIKLADSARAGVILPYNNSNTDEKILMLLMPMMLE